MQIRFLPSFHRVRLQAWMTVVIVLGTVPLFILSTTVLSSMMEPQLVQYAEAQLEHTNLIISTRVSNMLDLNVGILRQMASFDQIVNLDPAHKPLLEQTSKSFPHLSIIHSVLPDGTDLVRSDDAALGNWADRPWFQGAISGKDPSWQLLVTKTAGKPSLAVAVPIRDANGKIVGVLESNSELEDITAMLELNQSEDIHFHEEEMTSFVVDVSGEKSIMIAHPDPEAADATTDVSAYPPVAALRAGTRGLFNFTDEQGVEWAAYLSVLSNGWGVVTQQPKASVLAALNDIHLLRFGVTAVGALLTTLLAYLVSRWLSTPILELTHKAQLIADGDLNQQVAESGSLEISNLARAFNAMTAKLRTMLENERTGRVYLTNAVQAYLDHLNQVAAGNLSARLAANTYSYDSDEQDPMLLLAQALNQMTASQQEIIRQIRETAADLSATSSEMLAASAQQAAGAAETSAAIQQTTITVDEVKAIAEQSSMRATEVTSTSQRTVQVSQQGRQAVGDTIESMSQIKQGVSGIAENTLVLSEKMQQIGDILATVNDLAAQSNMLALNASVEAARAGEHGRGFAVVAAEVRALSEQSRAAVQQIREILTEIQRATNATVMATEEGTKTVDKGIVLAAEAKHAIENLSEVILIASQSVQQVAAGGQQQMAGVNQVAMAMQSIQEATVQNQASARQTERAAQELNNLAKKLEAIVGRYRLN